MAEQGDTLLLSLLIIILGSLHCSAAYECTTEAGNVTALYSRLSWCCDNIYYGIPNTSVGSACAVSNTSSYLFRGRPDTFHSYLAPVYVLVDIIPLVIYFPLLVLFNVNLVAGPAQSFVFFYQALPAAIPIDTVNQVPFAIWSGHLLWGFATMQSPINDIAFPHILPYITLKYGKLIVALVVTIMTVLLVKCIDCPCASWRRPWAKVRRSVRHFRERRAWKGTVLSGLCSIAILTYSFVIQQSFAILQPAKWCPGGAYYCSFYCTELEYCSAHDCSVALLLPAAAFLLVGLCLFLPLLLLYYPCVPALMQRVTKRSSPLITCHKLAPVFDVFQSAYKPKLRFFAAVPLLYRFVIWLLFSLLSEKLPKSDRQLIITFAFILILAIHSVFQPYSNPRHNYIETLYLLNLVLISMMSTITLQLLNAVITDIDMDRLSVIQFLPTALAYLPLLVGTVYVVYILWKCKYCKRCRGNCCKKVNRSRRESAQDELVQVQPIASEVYFDMSEVEQMKINQD